MLEKLGLDEENKPKEAIFKLKKALAEAEIDRDDYFARWQSNARDTALSTAKTTAQKGATTEQILAEADKIHSWLTKKD
jgi:hypothetical protein